MYGREWLPPKIYYEDYESDWSKYEIELYSVFREDFIESKPTYNNKVVTIRRHPIEFGKEECFFHVTCVDYNNDGIRVPDFRRCERVRWIRSIIEKADGDPLAVLIWKKRYKANYRVHLLCESERYMVVLEEREHYCLLITAFYIEREHTLRKKLKEYTDYHDSLNK